MAPRTATVFSLALFPQVFLFERVLNADVVLVLHDRNEVLKAELTAINQYFLPRRDVRALGAQG